MLHMRLPTKAMAPRISAATIATNTTYVEALAAEAFAGRGSKFARSICSSNFLSTDIFPSRCCEDRHVPHLSSLLDVVPLPMLAPARRPHSSPWFKASARLRGIPSPAQRLVGEADTISAAFAPLLHFIQALVAAADVIECLALHFREGILHHPRQCLGDADGAIRWAGDDAKAAGLWVRPHVGHVANALLSVVREVGTLVSRSASLLAIFSGTDIVEHRA
mmetsp:Transcript_41557/g.134230  ORF Transcript_41557/g.134230 Transcript_41557/m.134230 type:complete len:221 (-) Transcript_41557:2781-3443(-)